MTRKLLPILILLLAFSGSMYGQRNCNAMEVLDQQIQDNPERLIQLQEIEKFTQKFLKNADQKEGELVTIPVVVHVVYNTSAENISTSQINSQIQILNDDFRRLNSDADGTWPQAADTEIEFCLATQDANGNAHTGITRTSTSVSSFSANDNMKFNSSGGHDAWPAADYLNFWVCDLSGGLLGYAQFPGGPANTDGVVCDYQYVGNEGTATPPFDLGRTATHEVGHWLNLRHIWGDGGCGVDDFVSDTPLSDASNGGCAVGHVSCGTTDMVQNYMDYSDDACMNLYTAGQRDRMHALFAQGGARESLLSSPGCGGGGGPGGCTDTEITLTLNFDNYPEETTWEIRNDGGGLEASGGPYGSQPDGSTLVVDICLTDGCYDFTIFDSYGDGMCCGYGNGSYSLDDGPTNLASGGAFGSSETTNFCLGGGGGDTEAPSTPGNLSASNTTQTSTDLSWNASTDNVGVTGYNVYVDGSLDVSTAGTSYTVSGLSAETSYTMSVEAYDAAGNVSGQASTNVTTQSSGGGGSDVILAHFFETGWDGWQDGGSDCYRYSGSRSWEGNYSIRIRDNSGTNSAMTSSSYDVSSYDQLEIEFYFYPNSMENGEDFWVRYYNGSNWSTVASYARGTDFNNNSFYVATVTLNSSQYNFPTNAQFRFQCDASGNGDRIYIDAVTITGTSGARVADLGPVFTTIERLGGLNDGDDFLDQDFLLHPNPASDFITIEAEENIKSLQIYSITGSLVMDLKNLESHTQIDISKLRAGLYLINLETEEEVLSQKFVKQ